MDAARPLSGGFFTPSNKKKIVPRRRNSDGDKVNTSSDDGWVTASADEDYDDEDEEVDDSATLLRNASKLTDGGSAKPRTLRFTRDTSIMAPEPCPEMAGVPRAEVWRETPTLLRHRQGGRLEPWEAVRRRTIALPNTPHTAHSIMFLNHQPGETSDFTETLQRIPKRAEKVEEEINAKEGDDRRIDRFPMQFGQWDGVEGYSSGTLPSARNIVDGCRRREKENEKKEEDKEEIAETKGRERLYKTRTKGARLNRGAIKKSQDLSTNLTSPTDSKTETEGSSNLGAKSPETDRNGSIGGSLESLMSPTNTGVRRRSGNSQLPPVPPQEVGGSSPVLSPPTSPSVDGRSCTLDPSLIIEEDVESLAETSSLYDDHVYDVPSDVISKAAEEVTDRQSDADIASSADVSVSDKPPGFSDAPQLERKDSLDGILPASPSDTSLFDANSLSYNFYPNNRARNSSFSHMSGESTTENYIYNGSLLSVVSSDSDAASALYYHQQQQKNPTGRGRRLHDDPAAILRNRLKTGDGSIYGRPIIFMMGGKPIVFSESSQSQTEHDPALKDSFPDSVSMTFREDRDLRAESFQPQPVTIAEGDCLPLTVDVNSDVYDPGSSYSAPPATLQCGCEVCASSGRHGTAGLVTFDPSTKLKLWDLRLICLNREENQYSTYPPRRPTLDDRGVGPVDAADNLYDLQPEAKRSGRVLRHRSDVSTDHYVTRKINRLLRAPVLTCADSPPIPSEHHQLSPPKHGGDSHLLTNRDLPDFPTDGLRSLYRSFLDDDDSVSGSVPDKDLSLTPLPSGKEEVLVSSALTPSIPTCLNPYRTLTSGDAKSAETSSWPAIFSNNGDNINLAGWRNFLTEKMFHARQAWPGSGTDEETITSGCPRPLPVNWPFDGESNAVPARVESDGETDGSVYIYKPLGLSGMYEWGRGRGRGRSAGEDSSSSNISGDDVNKQRSQHYHKKRRHQNGHHHHHHRHHQGGQLDCPASDKSVPVTKKDSATDQNVNARNRGTHKHSHPSYHHRHNINKNNINNNNNNRNIVVTTSDADEDSTAYDSSSIYNASIRSAGSSSVYYGGTSNISASTSRSNLNNINIFSNFTDAGSGSSSSDSNNQSYLKPRDGSKSLTPGPASSSGNGRELLTDRRGNQVIWGDASIVDWRRQADKFRENHFITLIL